MSNVIPFEQLDADEVEALKTLDNSRNVIKFWSFMLLLVMVVAGVFAITTKVGTLYDGVEVTPSEDAQQP